MTHFNPPLIVLSLLFFPSLFFVPNFLIISLFLAVTPSAPCNPTAPLTRLAQTSLPHRLATASHLPPLPPHRMRRRASNKMRPRAIDRRGIRRFR
ncbi:hypothetical protein B0H13DRAFT_822346 [Mycena leptocephala]|nr:hypothetical protein B0H13DRAFT_822346 [Mycena leptocephala]